MKDWLGRVFEELDEWQNIEICIDVPLRQQSAIQEDVVYEIIKLKSKDILFNQSLQFI